MYSWRQLVGVCSAWCDEHDKWMRFYEQNKKQQQKLLVWFVLFVCWLWWAQINMYLLGFDFIFFLSSSYILWTMWMMAEGIGIRNNARPLMPHTVSLSVCSINFMCGDGRDATLPASAMIIDCGIDRDKILHIDRDKSDTHTRYLGIEAHSIRHRMIIECDADCSIHET